MLLELFISFLCTMVAYLIFPIIYVYTKGKVTKKKGKKIALWNSIVCEAIFTIIGFAIGLQPATNGSMFAQGVLYYFIAKRILINYSLKDELDQNKNNKEDVYTCEQCGTQMFSDEEKCSNCKKANPYFSNKNLATNNEQITDNKTTSSTQLKKTPDSDSTNTKRQ